MPNKKKIKKPKNKHPKPELFIKKYIDENGKSKIIERYKELIEPLRWTSGDSIFRSDSSLCKKYKLFRFKKKINWNDKSSQWKLTKEEKKEIEEIHAKLH